MIYYQGIKYFNKIPHLIFCNENNISVEIPVEIPVADRISGYLLKISSPGQILESQGEENGE